MIEIVTTAYKPDAVCKYRIGDHYNYLINFDIEDRGDYWESKQIHIHKRENDYDSLVNTMVSEMYPLDKMQAIINNYLLEPTDPVILEEFNRMQNFRKEAKKLAKEILTK